MDGAVYVNPERPRTTVEGDRMKGRVDVWKETCR
jgi:hypothetical protein